MELLGLETQSHDLNMPGASHSIQHGSAALIELKPEISKEKGGRLSCTCYKWEVQGQAKLTGL